MKRKILSIALVAMMVIALMVPCFAATVTITGNTNATYQGFKLLEAVPGTANDIDGTETNVFAYTVNENFRALLNEVIGTLLDESFPNDYAPTFGELQGYAIDPIVDYIYSLDDAGLRKFADAVYAAISTTLTTEEWKLGGINLTENEDYFEITAGAQSATTSPIQDGYWLIVETGNGESGENVPIYSLVMLDTAWADGGEITITAKTNTAPIIKKYVRNSVNNWVKNAVVNLETDTQIEYMLVGSIPQGDLDVLIHENFVYKFVDDLGYDVTQKLTVNENSVKVYISATEPDENFVVDGNSLLGENSYTKTGFTGNSAINSIEILIEESETNVGKPVVKDALGNEVFVTGSSHFIVCYTATITDPNTFVAGTVAENAGIPNNAYIEYSVDVYNSEIEQTTEDTATIYTTQFDITKVTENPTTPLEGAKFVLSDSITLSGSQIAYFNGQTLEPNEIAAYDLPAYFSSWVEYEESDGIPTVGSVLVSNAAGKIIIKGLGVGTYYLHEIVAPTGYNLLKNPIVIVVDEVEVGVGEPSSTIGITVTLGDETLNNGSVQTGIESFDVVNVSGLELPSTGGVGTTIMYIGGTALLIGAGIALAIYFLTDKRRRYADRTK